jgi:serine protease Do
MPSRSLQSLGSGVLIDAQRHVLTNAHVVSAADKIRVQLADGREFDATAVGADPNNDLAVLRVETKEALPWIPPGRSDDLLVGEPVIAIGNPFGLSNTVTTGVISAVDRSIRTDQRVFHGFLQTDASINPGNSGGPLLNAEGKLIGINTAIYGNAEGIGFAIPIDVARRIVDELIAHGEVAPVWLGLDLQALDPELRSLMKIPASVNGALVSRVHAKGPAASGGVRRGDVVVRLEGQVIADPRAFYEVLSRVTQGQAARLEVWREGQARSVRVVARTLPEGLVEELAEELLGMRLSVNPQGGFVVQTVRNDSGAARIGIQAGDLLLAVNGRTLQGKDALRTSVLDLRGRSRALLVVQRGRGRYHVTVPLG